MDGSRFAAWTRRRFGAAAAGALLGLRALVAGEAARDRAAKKRRKRQCEKLGTHCNPHNDRKVCCSELVCSSVPALGGRRCCRLRYGECQRDADCCGHLRCMEGANRFCDNAPG